MMSQSPVPALCLDIILISVHVASESMVLHSLLSNVILFYNGFRIIDEWYGETSKFTTESHKMLQGDVGELFL